MLKETRLSPLVKWPGGKGKELRHILPALPKDASRYFEPFIGGGAVYFAINCDELFINDFSNELINLYNCVARQDELFHRHLNDIIHNWHLLGKFPDAHRNEIITTYRNYSLDLIDEQQLKDWVIAFLISHAEELNGMLKVKFNTNIDNFPKELKKNVFKKLKRIKKIEAENYRLPDDDILDNFESSLKSALYMHLRYLHNRAVQFGFTHSFNAAVYFFIRNYCYSSMFRYNSKGDFNVPYGGIGYNKKSLDRKLKYFMSKELLKHMERTTICNQDFEVFLRENDPREGDFIFLDPPYDSEFSTYSQNAFTRKDQSRLADYLIHECKAKWMLVIKNTEFIFGLYHQQGVSIGSFEKTYLVSFMNRNDKDADHLLITNY